MGKNDDIPIAVTRSDSTPHSSQDPDAADPPAGQEEYMMFVDHDDAPPLANDSLPPPTYQDSILSTQDPKVSSSHSTLPSSSSSKQSLPTFHFFRASSLKSKEARLVSTDGREYRLTADIHKSTASTISLYSGTTCCGSVSFTPGSNNFQIMTSGAKGNAAPADLIQVRAKIGVPHPQSYTFTLPSGSAGKSKGKEVVWTKERSSTGYQLQDTTWHTSLATWELVEREKFDAVLEWQEHPRDEREEIVVLLSFIGSMTRLRLKGKDLSGMPSSGRWGAFWYMAILGTAGMADI